MGEPTINGPETTAPQIQPIIVDLGGVPAQLLFFADPKEFPVGAEVICMRPGQIAPVAKMLMPPCTMLVGIPPEVAPRLLSWVRQQIAEAMKKPTDPGKTKPPGLHLV